MHLFSFPITLLTLGLFALVINAIIILLADHFTDGIQIDGFWWALIFSVIFYLLSLGFRKHLHQQRINSFHFKYDSNLKKLRFFSKNFENPLQNSVKHFISGFYIFTKIKTIY